MEIGGNDQERNLLKYFEIDRNIQPSAVKLIEIGGNCGNRNRLKFASRNI